MAVSFDDDDRDAPLDEDLNEPDPDDEVLPCPSCGRQVFEDAERCPYCGDWIVTRMGRGGLPWIWVLAAILALAAMIVITVF